MLKRDLISIFLPCAGTGVAFAIYLLIWYVARKIPIIRSQDPEKDPSGRGLSALELQKISVTESVINGTECAVCLDEIERGQAARVLPDCKHTFHLCCADKWLSKSPVCPLCRANLESEQTGTIG